MRHSTILLTALVRCLGDTQRRCKFHAGVVVMAASSGDWSVLASPRPMVGVVQMTSTPDKESNFCQAKALIMRAKHRGVEMVFLPECFDYVSESRHGALDAAEPIDGDIISRYRSMAKEEQLWLSLGGFHEKSKNRPDEKRIFITHLIIDKHGEIQGRYSKTHLFDVDIKGGVKLSETDFAIPGESINAPVATPAGNVGMAICYDLRFPELSIALAQRGADILTYPSAFTVPTGMAHWEVLLRSRAIENQCYVIAAAQVGNHHSKRASYGHAMVVDPWGTVISECHGQPDVCVAEIDLPYLSKRREEMPVWKHRRHDLYGHIQLTAKEPIDSCEQYQFGQHLISAGAVFYKSAISIGFVNRKPVLPGHVLVCPTRPAPRLTDLTAAETADLFQSVQDISRVIQAEYGASSLTVAVQDGPDAGQTVQHVHVHILPRRPGDFQTNDDVYDKLEKHDKDESKSKWRTEEDMAAEAAKLRPLFI